MEEARIRRNTVGDVCRLVCRYSALVVSTPTSALVLLHDHATDAVIEGAVIVITAP